MFTVLPYIYRDAGNHKQHSQIVLEGKLTREQVAAIESKLDDGEYFIPGNLTLGIEELQPRMATFPSDDDHVYHELDFEGMETVRTVPDGSDVIPVESFVKAFEAIPDANAWDVQAASDRLGLE